MVSLIATTPGGMGKYLHIIVEEIVQSVERIMGYCCQVGVSRSVNTLGKCRESYLEAMNALSYSRKDKSSVYFISDAEHGSGLEQGEIQEITATMENFYVVEWQRIWRFIWMIWKRSCEMEARIHWYLVRYF